MELKIKTPRWALPLLRPKRYKGAKGGRGGGKSQFFAESCVEALVQYPDTRIVCIREIQKSLKYSAKSLIEGKIKALKVGHLFDIQTTEIRAKQGEGLIIFQGMQDHTADSIKSLEGFNIAWVEEAQSLSKRSLDLLRPTIRAEGSEIWFSWNPRFEDDAVDVFMRTGDKADFVLVHVNSEDNPWLPDTLADERERDRIDRPDDFGHIWLGEYVKGDDESFINYRVVESAVERDNEPYSNWVRILGIDPSQTKDGDATGLVIRHGNKITKIAEFNRETVQERADVIRRFMNENGIDHAFIDQGGSGKEIYDLLIQWGVERKTITLVPFGARASNKQLYPNKRVEMYSDLRNWLREDGDIPNIEKFKYELSLTKTKINNNGQEVLESKKDMRKSPNLADAAALTFAYPVTKRKQTTAGSY